MTATVNTRRNEATRNFTLELLVVVLSIVTLTNGVHGYAKPITWFVLALFVLMATCQPLIISKLHTDRTMGGAPFVTRPDAVASSPAPSAATSSQVSKLKRSATTIDLEGKIAGSVSVIGGVVMSFVVTPFTFGLVEALFGVHLVISCRFMVSKTQVALGRLEAKSA